MAADIRTTKAELMRATFNLTQALEHLQVAQPSHFSAMNAPICNEVAALEKDVRMLRDRIENYVGRL